MRVNRRKVTFDKLRTRIAIISGTALLSKIDYAPVSVEHKRAARIIEASEALLKDIEKAFGFTKASATPKADQSAHLGAIRG